MSFSLGRNRFVQETADSLNRFWPDLGKEYLAGVKESEIALQADARVRRVLSQLDGTDWSAARRIKHSFFADWWFRVSGIDGMFNPFGHEPLLVSGIPDFELPFLIAHELAHVLLLGEGRGFDAHQAGEGDLRVVQREDELGRHPGARLQVTGTVMPAATSGRGTGGSTRPRRECGAERGSECGGGQAPGPPISAP